MGVVPGSCAEPWVDGVLTLRSPGPDRSPVVVVDGRERGAPAPEALAGLGAGRRVIVFGLSDDQLETTMSAHRGTWRFGQRGTLSTERPATWPGNPVVVITAGTVDSPVARCVSGLCIAFGACVDAIEDVGVAGLHRVTAESARLRDARVIVVCAGMDGALPRVVAELCDAAVVFVPSPVGYGVAEDGLAAFLCGVSGVRSGVSCCAPGDVIGAAFLSLRLARLFAEGGSVR